MKSKKKDFPIFTNNPDLVYLDSSATSQKPQVVLDAVSEYYSSYNANIHRGLYKIAEKASEKVGEVREKVAAFINAGDSDEIIFTKSATEAINLVMYSWGKENIRKGDVIITTVMEHHANFVPWQVLAAENDALFYSVDISDDGYINENELLESAASAKILAISLVSNMLGTILPLSRLIREIRTRNKDIVILIDAAQAVPHLPVDVRELDCDFLVFSGHKMLSETGIGVLYGKKALLQSMHPFLFGGDMIREVTAEQTSFADLPNKLEGGTLHIAGIISLGAAIDYLTKIGIDKIIEHEKRLTRYCAEALREINGLILYGPQTIADRSGLVSFGLDGIHPHDIAQILADDNVCVRSGHHCTMPLHKRFAIEASVRASFYLYNDESDIDRLIKGIYKAIKIFS